MPDDEVIELTEEVAEQDDETLQVAEDSFDEDDDAPEKEPEKEPEKDKASEKDESEKADEAEEKEEKKEPTAKEKAEALAEKKSKSAPSREPPPKDTPPPPKKDVKKEAPVKASESLDELLQGGEIEVDGVKLNLKAYKEEYPEDFAVMLKLAETIAKTSTAKMLKELELPNKKKLDDVANIFANDLDRTLESRAFNRWLNDYPDDVKDWAKSTTSMKDKAEIVQTYRASVDFLNEVEAVHSDARKIRSSEKFQVWLKEQPAKIQALGKEMDVDSACALIEYFKEDQARKNVKKHDKKQSDKKKRHDDIHSSTTRSKQAVKKSGGKDMNDAEAAFNEDDDEDE